VPSGTGASGQPWHLPYRLWLTIRLGPVPPSPADSASQARGAPGRGLALRARPADRSRVAEDRSTRSRPRPDGTGRPVRAGSVSQRSSSGMGGHQRSPTVRRNHRSEALRPKQLG
jgi:hypothetical protein